MINDLIKKLIILFPDKRVSIESKFISDYYHEKRKPVRIAWWLYISDTMCREFETIDALRKYIDDIEQLGVDNVEFNKRILGE